MEKQKQENKQELVQASQALLGADDKGTVVYQANGEEVKLSFNAVRRYLTRGTGSATDAEVIQFIALCKANGLNPFTGDCYMITYGSSPATMVTSRDAFMRRAESNPAYDGFESGVIVLRKDEVVELPGSFFIPGREELVGGWAKVYRSDRRMQIPVFQRVSLREYNTGKSNWASKPGTMIQKVAEAQAFRKAFPNQTSGLYIPEEMPDDQRPAEEQKPQESIKPVFQQVDAEAPAFVPDPEPAEPMDVEPAEESPALKELMGEDDKTASLFKI